jgi:N-acyl-D-amino-acid deacylase
MTAMRRFLLAGLAAAGLAGAHQNPPRTILIAGGTLIDGTGGVPRRADVRLRGDTIAEIAASLSPLADERVVDASGQTVAPGFIDMHSHADRGIGEHPDASSQVLQGITTSVVGQDGGGTMPVSDFFAEIESSHPAINFAAMVGHGTVRGLVLGADYKRKATSAEIETMKALVDRGMRDGALGLSSGLEYDPGFYAETSEVVELARVAGRYGGLYASHVRDEENTVLDAWREAIDVGRKAGVPVEISHMKLASKPVWGRAADGLALLESARRDGVTVMADWYPYTYWQSSLYVLIPDRDFDNRRKWEIGLEEIGGPQNVLITNYRPDPSFNGRTIAEIAASSGKDPISLIIGMIHSAGPGIGIIGTAMTEPDLEKLFAHPQVLICSDGGLTGRHPRGYGTFPRVLGRYVRDRKLVALPEAIAKMTGRSAHQLGLSDRGVLAVGMKADVVVFDATAIQDAGTPQEPSQPPTGVKAVIVNGEPVILDGVMTSARPGRALRHEAKSPASAVRQ